MAPALDKHHNIEVFFLQRNNNMQERQGSVVRTWYDYGSLAFDIILIPRTLNKFFISERYFVGLDMPCLTVLVNKYDRRIGAAMQKLYVLHMKFVQPLNKEHSCRNGRRLGGMSSTARLAPD